MPVEVIFLIIHELPVEDYLYLIRTYQRLRRIVQENSHVSDLTSLATPEVSCPYRGFRITNLLQSEGRGSMNDLRGLGSPVYNLANPRNTQARPRARALQKDWLCRSC